MNTIALYSMKGGVGKTATAVNIAHLGARDGLRTLLWDMDPQGAASYYFRMSPKGKGRGRDLIRAKCGPEDLVRGSDFDNLDLLPADFSYRKMETALAEVRRPRRRIARLTKPLSERYDLLLLDCAPSISRLSESVFAAADALLIPVIPTTLSLRTLAHLLTHLRKRKALSLSVMPFFSMVDRRKSLHRHVCETVANEDLGFLRTEVPYCTDVEQMGLHRRPLHAFAPRSPAAAAFRQLADEVRLRIGEAPNTDQMRRKVLARIEAIGRSMPATADRELETGE